MGGPVELPRVWAFQTDDGDPRVSRSSRPRSTIEFEADADPGIYLAHCHKVNHAMNGETYPGEMVGDVVYESAMDTDIFADLTEYAGYEG